MKRNEFIKKALAISMLGALSPIVRGMEPKEKALSKSRVYFTKEITPEKLIELYRVLGRELKGRVAVKVHSGEPGGKNFIQPQFMKPLVDLVKGTIVECNTAYEGRRNTTLKHWEAIKEHGFAKIAGVDIMDADGDMALAVSEGRQIKVNYVGSHLADYDSVLVLSHFKGHQMGGFGGALKNLSIGIASSRGKAHIHGAGNPEKMWDCEQDKFLEAMADACKSIMDYKRDALAFINVMKDMSIDCDCNKNPKAPEMADIGMLASIDPVAIDQACVDLVYASKDKGKASLIKRMEEKNGIHTVKAAEELGIGTRKYELVNLDS